MQREWVELDGSPFDPLKCEHKGVVVSVFLKILVLVVLLTANVSWGATFQVANQSEFEAALAQSAVNFQDDRILIYEGAEIESKPYQNEIGFSVQIEGGYNWDFSARQQSIPPITHDLQFKRATPKGFFKPLERQKSTSGPIPPANVVLTTVRTATFDAAAGGSTEKVLGVPAYIWRHGCGPTAVGMVAGYYDARGFSNFFDGDAATQTSAVNQGIASQRTSSNPGHYEDYSLPLDDSEPSPLRDNSENGGAHQSDSIADFMRTSWSLDGMQYGWSWSDRLPPALVAYAALKDTNYQVDFVELGFAQMPWDFLTNEIDNNRPMVFLVDSNADGYTDHFVPIVGYRISGDTYQYGCLDTWGTAVRWEEYQGMQAGRAWGVYGGSTFAISKESSASVVPAIKLLLQD